MVSLGWESRGEPVTDEDFSMIERQIGYSLPSELKNLYKIGDSPCPAVKNDEYIFYRLNDSRIDCEKYYGYATYFMSAHEDPMDSTIMNSFRDPRPILPDNCIEISEDGGGEALVLRYDTETPTVWHFSPNGRIHDTETLFFVADNFAEFLTKLEIGRHQAG